MPPAPSAMRCRARGWWGFAALVEADAPGKAPDGSEVPIEQGGLIWVKATDMTAGR